MFDGAAVINHAGASSTPHTQMRHKKYVEVKFQSCITNHCVAWKGRIFQHSYWEVSSNLFLASKQNKTLHQ